MNKSSLYSRLISQICTNHSGGMRTKSEDNL